MYHYNIILGRAGLTQRSVLFRVDTPSGEPGLIHVLRILHSRVSQRHAGIVKESHSLCFRAQENSSQLILPSVGGLSPAACRGME